jgi:hypothetical protein
MEVYKSECKETIRRFLNRRLSFPNCIAGLDAALAGLMPRMTGDELPAVRSLMLANNEIVMKEMERRFRHVLQSPVPRVRASHRKIPCRS